MIRALSAVALSLFVIFVSWSYYLRIESRESLSANMVRQAMVQHQHAEQRLRRLDDGQTSPLLVVLGEDLSTVQIRVAEYLAGLGSESSDNQLMYEQSLLASPLLTAGLVNTIDTKIQAIRILRLEIQVQLSHAQEFMELLSGIYTEVGGWPIMVRACDIQKIPLQLLNVRCVMDIYHWSADWKETNS